ncbi:nucleotidyltransferase domain-containing protein [Streptomyces sp. RO-S4]|uniref:nucleotidyltransferase domain-containing protein n=1 Tax=unclassified Streptomyces TaxID=2593676 RepID=UPI00208EFA1E|nr:MULTISPECIES: nucleotidyltransferase domain-containing protein [unclassified Streptomyces]MCO4694921.1 nucleotidyltransferase domain-containing protein [Streptomyces sp. RO-S4]MDU0302417.1 nucleotidyltransferase domain-containing protein [Streptomyces sp. PAL114]
MQQTDALLDRFLTGLAPLSPVAVWAHGSLAGGDYVEGRSDLDLIAVLPAPIGPRTVWRLAVLHARLRAEPLAAGLHCTYLTPDTTAGAERRHLTWAHEQLFRRTVTPVTRTELHTFGRVLRGAAPADVLPLVPDGELAAYVLRDQRDYWRPHVDRTDLWTRDIWVDLGMVTFARVTVTVREGRLISKREALEVLPGLGAPEEVVADIRARRYGGTVATDEKWILRRAELVRGYLGPAIDGLVAGS